MRHSRLVIPLSLNLVIRPDYISPRWVASGSAPPAIRAGRADGSTRARPYPTRLPRGTFRVPELLARSASNSRVLDCRFGWEKRTRFVCDRATGLQGMSSLSWSRGSEDGLGSFTVAHDSLSLAGLRLCSMSFEGRHGKSAGQQRIDPFCRP
jgi:hypothetical protein